MSTNWKHRASLIAQCHHEDDFPTRMGAVQLCAENAFYIFNKLSSATWDARPEQKLNQIREAAAKLGIEELGYGEFPIKGSMKAIATPSSLQEMNISANKLKNCCGRKGEPHIDRGLHSLP